MTAISANTVIFSYNTNTINIRVSKYLKLVIDLKQSSSKYSLKEFTDFMFFSALINQNIAMGVQLQAFVLT